MKPSLKFPGFASFLVAFFNFAASVLAANDTWNGGSSGTGNWSDTANWGGSTVATGNLLFFGGTVRVINTNDLPGYSFTGITFNSGAGLFNLRGNTFDLTGGITNSSTSGQTLNNNITLSAGIHVILAPASTANITNNGNISEDGSGSASLTFSTPGSKTLVLNGSNSLSGGLTLAGTSTTQFGLVLGNTNALGMNWINVNNGALNLSAVEPGANPFVIASPFFTNSRDAYYNGSNVLFTGLYVIGGQKQIAVSSGQTVTLSGGLYNIGGDFALKTGSGTLVLNGALNGGQGTSAENGVNYANSFRIGNGGTSGYTGAGTLVLGNPSALGSSAGYFVVDGGGSAIMANTDLSGANALTANVVLSAANGGTGVTIGGANNITFGGNFYNSIGTAGTVTRYLIVTNTAVTAFSGGSAFLSDGSSPGTLSVNVAGTSGGVVVSDSMSDGNQPGGSLIKTNAGILILSGANGYTGSTTINGGQLWVNAQGASQSSTFVVSTNGGLVFTNDPAFVLGGLSGSGNISLLNNPGSPVALTVGNNNASTVYSGMLSDGAAGASLTKTGSGTLTLSGTNNYTGLTAVNHGTLVISPNFAGQGNLTISESATLGVTTNTPSTSAQIGTLQFGSSGSGSTTLLFSSLPAPTKAPITAVTINTIDGASSINVAINVALNVGTYNLINYTSFIGDGFGDFAAPTLPSGTVGYLTNNTTASPPVVQLVITSTALDLWTGSINTNWDFSTYNWKFNSLATNYSDGAPIRFDDTSSQPDVYLTANVQPFSILVTNNASNYTFSSAGNYIYGASTLIKNGTGSLSMVNLNNAFTGDVVINGGTVSVASGTLSGGNITLNNGSLILNSSILGNQGAVTLNGGTSLVLSNSTALTNNITDNSSIVSGSGTQSMMGNIIGNGSLTQNGNGVLTLSGLNTFSGGTAVNAGSVILANPTTSLGTGSVTLGDGTTADEATLTFGSAGQTMNNNILVAAGGTGTYTINGFTSSATLQNGGVVVSNNVIIGGNLTLNGVVSGSGMITANFGSGSLSRFSNGNNTWTGNLVLTNNGTFKTVTGSMNSNNVVYVNSGSTFDTFAQSLTIAGLNDGANGSGTVVVPASHVLTLGGSGSYNFSGVLDNNAGNLLMDGTGTQILSGANTYTGSTVVSNGTLIINGSLTNGAVNVYGGMLAGTGTLNGPTTVYSGTLAPAGNSVIGTLTISNSLSLQGTLAVDIDKTAGTNDLITGLTSVTFGGTLAMNNLSGTLTTTDSFKLFNAGSYNGSFVNITPATPATGLAWNTSTLTTDGILRISTGTASNPTNITVSVSSGQIIVAWPADHTGWYLQAQTNTIGTGLGTNWVTITNSSLANGYTNTIDPANGTVFYRLSNQP